MKGIKMRKSNVKSHVDLKIKTKFLFTCAVLLIIGFIVALCVVFSNNAVASTSKQSAVLTDELTAKTTDVPAVSDETSVKKDVQISEPTAVKEQDSQKPAVDVNSDNVNKKASLPESVTGKLSPGTGGTPLGGCNPYVWLVGLYETYEPYVGTLSYDVSADGIFKLNIPSDLMYAAIIVGATDHQTTVKKIETADMGIIYLPAGRTTTFNSEAKGFKSLNLLAGSSFKIFDIPVFKLAMDKDLGKKLPAIGF